MSDERSTTGLKANRNIDLSLAITGAVFRWGSERGRRWQCFVPTVKEGQVVAKVVGGLWFGSIGSMQW